MFLHSFNPDPILVSIGPFSIHWYGLFMVLGIVAGIITIFRLAKYYKIKNDFLFDLFFWLIIGGLVGARIYDVFLNIDYYFIYPWRAFEIWNGGLAIHGAIIAGLIIVYIFSKKEKINFWKLSSLLAPGLVLGQAIGRWGNYFNQELFGLPTNNPIGIPINIINRPPEYLSFSYFQPTFLYESLGCLLIFIILLIINIYFIKINKLVSPFYTWSVALYMILYSILRFFLEFIRIDKTPIILGLRFPQIISLLIILIFSFIIISKSNAQEKN
jgi:phosphatidylglycerol:prolipoprotein diacylglycerol transferase